MLNHLSDLVTSNGEVASGIEYVGLFVEHAADAGGHAYKMPPNDYYTIPYRALVPKDGKNLIVAGRSISASHEAIAAVRIMPITTCMGEAAGIAASMAIDSDCSMAEVDVAALREKITSYGGLV